MKTAKIVIPTYKRPDNVCALEFISPESQRKHFWLAVREEELEAYKANYPHCNYKVLPNVTNVCNTRQRVNEIFNGTVIVIDDDVRFHRTELMYDVINKNGDKKHYEKGIIKVRDMLDDDGLDEMLQYVQELSEEYPYGSIRCFHFPRGEDYFPYALDKPAIWCVWFNLEKFDVKKYNYENGPVFLEDIYMSVAYYDGGNSFPSVGKYAITKKSETGGQEGGCQTSDRYIEHNKSAQWLADNYPEYCVTKRSTQNSKTMGGEALTVIAKLSPRKREKRKTKNALETFFG